MKKVGYFIANERIFFRFRQFLTNRGCKKYLQRRILQVCDAKDMLIKYLLLLSDSLAQPVQTIIETISSHSACTLNVPVSASECM